MTIEEQLEEQKALRWAIEVRLSSYKRLVRLFRERDFMMAQRLGAPKEIADQYIELVSVLNGEIEYLCEVLGLNEEDQRV